MDHSNIAIWTHNLGCSFGRTHRVEAFSNVTLKIDRGQQICITGPSGSGKTTFLNVIGGLQEPTTGSLSVEGCSFDEMTATEIAHFRARRIGFVFQSPNLIPVLTAAENVDYALRLARPEITTPDRTRLVLEALELTDMASKSNQRPCRLSGGECQRVAIARAIVKGPTLLLADEPTSHLDDVNTKKVCEIFSRLRKHDRCTVLIATHDSRVLSDAYQLIRFQSGQAGHYRSDQQRLVGAAL